jgi:hypothetical protein
VQTVGTRLGVGQVGLEKRGDRGVRGVAGEERGDYWSQRGGDREVEGRVEGTEGQSEGNVGCQGVLRDKGERNQEKGEKSGKGRGKSKEDREGDRGTIG